MEFYDELLSLFLSDDDLRPAMMQANTVGDKTYATDAHKMLIAPTNKLNGEYPAHARTPNYQSVLNSIVPSEPILFKDTDLFTALSKTTKEPDSSPCGTCDGDGSCSHCGAECEDCDGTGNAEDYTKPEISSYRHELILIEGLYFSPSQLGQMEKVLLLTEHERFSIIGMSKAATLFKIDDIEIMIAAMLKDDDEEKKIIELKSTIKETV